MSEPHEQTFLKAYEEYSDAIFRFCIAKVGNRDTALDITQDTFTKTWDYLVSGKTVDNTRAFLYRIARNLIIDHFRKKKSVSLDSMLAEGLDFQHHVHERNELIFDAQRSLDALHELSKKDADILLMRYIQDMEIKDIADVMGEKENTISVRIHRALKKAQDIINEKNTYES